MVKAEFKMTQKLPIPRLKRPEFVRLIDFVKARFGFIRVINQFTVAGEAHDTRIRIALARTYKRTNRYVFSVGNGDFDYLVIGIEGRKEVWLVDKNNLDISSSGNMSLSVKDGVENIGVATLKGGGSELPLEPFLLFPTNEMVVKLRRAERERVKRELTEQQAILKRRVEAVERVDDDSDFAGLFAKVAARFGELTPISRSNWKLKDGSTVHFMVSKPYRGTIDRAFLGALPSVFEHDWLAIGVRGSEASWLIPSGVAKHFLASRPAPPPGTKPTFFLGLKDGQDRLWAGNESSLGVSTSIDAFKLYTTAPNKALEREVDRNKRLLDRQSQKAADKLESVARIVADDPNKHAVVKSVSKLLGKLTSLSSRPFVVQTQSDETVRIVLVKHWFANETRGLFTLSEDAFEHDWIVFAVRDQELGWLIRTSELKVFLSLYPSRQKKSGASWDIFFGPRDGEDLLWLGSEYKRGGFISLKDSSFIIKE